MWWIIRVENLKLIWLVVFSAVLPNLTNFIVGRKRNAPIYFQLNTPHSFSSVSTSNELKDFSVTFHCMLMGRSSARTDQSWPPIRISFSIYSEPPRIRQILFWLEFRCEDFQFCSTFVTQTHLRWNHQMWRKSTERPLYWTFRISRRLVRRVRRYFKSMSCNNDQLLSPDINAA